MENLQLTPDLTAKDLTEQEKNLTESGNLIVETIPTNENLQFKPKLNPNDL